MSKPLQIAIATNGRFHVLDLARELHAHGHSVRFYSWVPKARALRFGLPADCHVGLLDKVGLYAAWQRVRPSHHADLLKNECVAALNSAIIARLQPCDHFIGMSGLTLEAARHARRAFGARIWMERGSEHILAQVQAVREAAHRPDNTDIERELASYEIADRIVVPSAHVAESFAKYPSTYEKLFRNPYGVSLEQFPFRQRPQSNRAIVLMVGTWSHRKGCDLLTDAVMHLPDCDLLHVGAIGDLAFPRHPRFHHCDPVDQGRLTDFYARSDLMVLPSREEGLALVQAQALASGRLIVCSDRTGGRDLAHTPDLASRIRIFPSGDVCALRDALGTSLGQARSAPMTPLSQASLDALGWCAYGTRYSEELVGGSSAQSAAKREVA
jgi:glycosyltransferase involved in cell wall biosynthesis